MLFIARAGLMPRTAFVVYFNANQISIHFDSDGELTARPPGMAMQGGVGHELGEAEHGVAGGFLASQDGGQETARLRTCPGVPGKARDQAISGTAALAGMPSPVVAGA